MLLAGKTAIVYGGGNAAGAALARTFAREGALVFLAGRARRQLDELAQAIRAAGGTVEVCELDEFDQAAVDAHADRVVSITGEIDIVVNTIASGDAGGLPMSDLITENVLHSASQALITHSHTAAAAARHMTRRGSGMIMMMAEEPAAAPTQGSAYIAHAALFEFYRQLASQLRPDGLRVIWLTAPGPPGAAASTIQAPPATAPAFSHGPDLSDVANIAALLASHSARTMTAAEALQDQRREAGEDTAKGP